MKEGQEFIKLILNQHKNFKTFSKNNLSIEDFWEKSVKVKDNLALMILKFLRIFPDSKPHFNILSLF